MKSACPIALTKSLLKTGFPLSQLIACAAVFAALLLVTPASASADCSSPVPGGDPNKPGQCAGAGNPINVMTGNKYQREEDMPALPGVLGLEIVRHYNSAFSGPNHPNGVLGRGWRLSYEIEVVDRWGKIQVLLADGGRVIFDRDRNAPTGCSTRDPANGTMTIGRQNDGRPDYTWTWTDGRKLHFNTAGKLDRITAPSGEVVHLLYDDQNVLVRVIDPQGRSLNLVYYDRNAPNQFHGVQFIDTPVGRFAYEYGSEPPKGAGLLDKRQLLANLVRVRLPDEFDPTKKAHPLSSRGTTVSKTSRIYHHEDPRSPWLMTGISIETIGATGKATATRYSTFGYDDTGRAILSTHAGNVGKITLDNSKAGMTVLTNSLGKKTTYRYAAIGGEYRLLEVRGAGCALCGEPNVRYRYDDVGRLIESDKLSDNGDPVSTIRTERDKLGRISRVSRFVYQNGKRGPAQLQARYEYQGNDFAPVLVARPSVASGKEVVTRIEYNKAHQPLAVTESGWSPLHNDPHSARGIERTFRYRYTTINGHSLLAAIDGPLKNGPSNSPKDSDITLFEYDQINESSSIAGRNSSAYAVLASYEARQGVLARVIAPGSRVTSIVGWDPAGRPARISTPNGAAVEFKYDYRGHVVQRQIGSTREYFAYNELGQLARVRQATGQILHYTYGNDGRVKAIFDAQNNRIRLNRDTEGNVLSRELLNPDGSIAQQHTLQHLLAVSDDSGSTIRNQPRLESSAFLAPDAALTAARSRWFSDYYRSEQLKFSDARGIASQYVFDDFARLVGIKSADAGNTIFRYDAADNLTSKMIGDVTRNLSAIQYAYDVAGRVIEQLTTEGKTTIEYGKSDRPERIVFPAGEERYGYDDESRLVVHTRVIDGYSVTTRYDYDERGQLSKKTLPDGQILRYRYHGALHPKAGLLAEISRQDLFGRTVLLGSLNDPEDGFAKLGYQLANGVSFIQELNRDGSIARLGSPGVWEERHRRDAVGLFALRTGNGPEGRQTAYAFDPLGRLLGVATDQDKRNMRGYSYDANGNLLARLTGSLLTRYRIDPAKNHVLHAETLKGREDYFYNGAGSLERAGLKSYHWDTQQRLVKVEYAGKTVAEYAYNPFGERIKKTVYANNEKTVTYFFYDGSQLVAEASPNAGPISVNRQYVWLDDANGTRPIAMLEANSRRGNALPDRAVSALGGEMGRGAAQAQRTRVSAIVADHTGAPRAVVGDDRRVVWRADVLGYGEAKLSHGNLLSLNLRGSNQYFDDETELHYNTRRYLDPESGRYLSADPIGVFGGPNPYAFAENNPIDRVDPLGLQAKPAGPVSNWAFQDKLSFVGLRVAEKLPGELGAALKELVSPAALATTAGIFTLWAAAQFTPFGWAADAAVAGVGYALVGAAIWDVISGIYDSASLIENAKCEADLVRAADILAKGLSSAAVAAGAGAGTAAGSGKIANLLRVVFKDRAAGEKAAAVARVAEAWFGKFVPGRMRSGKTTNEEWLAMHPGEYPPWSSVRNVLDTWLNPGEKIYMINLKDAAGPGGWATPQRFTSLAEARKALALLEEFKGSGSNCCVLQEYIVKTPIPVREGFAGALQSKVPPYDSYPGGAKQWQFLLDRSLTKGDGWKNFLSEGTRTVLQP